jgi:hypothetical protein
LLTFSIGLTTPLGWCRVSKPSKVIGVRLDLDTIEELKKRSNGDVSKVLKKLIKEYVERPELIRPQLPEYIEKLLSLFKEKIDNYLVGVRAFCEEHAKIITENHEKEKDKYNYWRDLCLHRYRRITRNNLNVYVQDHLLKKINVHSLSKEEKIELERRINELIEYAVRSIYSSEFPPAYPK